MYRANTDGSLVDTGLRGEAASMLSAASDGKVLILGTTSATDEKRDHVGSPLLFGEVEGISSGEIAFHQRLVGSSFILHVEKRNLYLTNPREHAKTRQPHNPFPNGRKFFRLVPMACEYTKAWCSTLLFVVRIHGLSCRSDLG